MSVRSRARSNKKLFYKWKEEGRCISCGRKVIVGLRCDICNIKNSISRFGTQMRRLEKLIIRLIEQENKKCA